MNFAFPPTPVSPPSAVLSNASFTSLSFVVPAGNPSPTSTASPTPCANRSATSTAVDTASLTADATVLFTASSIFSLLEGAFVFDDPTAETSKGGWSS